MLEDRVVTTPDTRNKCHRTGVMGQALTFGGSKRVRGCHVQSALAGHRSSRRFLSHDRTCRRLLASTSELTLTEHAELPDTLRALALTDYAAALSLSRGSARLRLASGISRASASVRS